jgi:hypothetical protein
MKTIKTRKSSNFANFEENTIKTMMNAPNFLISEV